MIQKKFDAIEISLASPEDILSWSHGEVKKAETINYRNFRPEMEGLFCERIFGPVKDYECHCGKLKGVRYRGLVCERCGVEVTTSKVRRERFGHITLASPVVHIWYFRSTNIIPVLLDMSKNDVEKIVYYASYVVLDPGNSPLKYKQVINEEEYREYKERGYNFIAKRGSDAILELLKSIDLESLREELMEEIKRSSTKQKKTSAMKRLDYVEAFLKSGNKPEYMVLTVLPVIPPDLRPLLPLDGGRFASVDLNDLYRRVINRNNRLKKLIDVNAPEIMLQNEKRMLQEAVDALLDNTHKIHPIIGSHNRPLHSLSDILRGKQGRFRQNLLGKRVDYSGRSVIVVGPKLKLDECGLPRNMALELFKPFLMHNLEETGIALNLRSAKWMIEQAVKDQNSPVWKVLADTVKDYVVLLNRAPTLHRMSIQSFKPVLVDGEAIHISPLVCPPYNADFDGDQMAVHLPLSIAAQTEAKYLLLSKYNIISPAHGKPITLPVQDVVAGCYYLTKEKKGEKGEGLKFYTIEDLNAALDEGKVTYHTIIDFYWNKRWINNTTVGRVIFNNLVKETLEDENFEFFDRVIDQKTVNDLFFQVFKKYGFEKTAKLLDEVQKLGFEIVTLSGLTIGMDDMVIPKRRDEIIKQAEEKEKKLREFYEKGLMSENERYKKTIDVWLKAGEELVNEIFDTYNPFNFLLLMAISGARGKPEQILQMVGMRGLMSDPSGRIIEFPIKSNLKEGLSVLEYFISTHGARKGLADTALKTSDAGYLTRRLADVAHKVFVKYEDCEVVPVKPIVIGEKVIKSLYRQIVGKVAAKDVIDPNTGEIIVHENEEITRDKALEIENKNIEIVWVRNFTDGIEVEEIKEGQRIIETLEERILGRYAAEDIYSPSEKIVKYNIETEKPEEGFIAKDIVDEKLNIIAREGEKITTELLKKLIDNNIKEILIKIPSKRELIVKRGEEIDEVAVNKIKEYGIKKVKIRSVLTCSSPNGVCAKCYGRDLSTGKLVNLGEAVGIIASQSIGEPGTQLTLRTFHTGGIAAKDITSGLPRVEELFEVRKPKGSAIISEVTGYVTVRDEEDARKIIITPRTREIAVNIYEKLIEKLNNLMSVDSNLTITDLDLDRETLEVLTEAKIEKVKDILNLEKEELIKKLIGRETIYIVPYGKTLRVQNGDYVNVGDRLTEGPLDPHKIFQIKGLRETEQYLLQEIQKVYKSQGVTINDKHIEIILRELTRKAIIINPGDTKFYPGQEVERSEVEEENRVAKAESKNPATYKILLLRLTKAALSADSFLSASSFQETTKVLAEAAISGKIDTLEGLKEAIIVGSMIPVGTGFSEYDGIKIIEKKELVEERESV
ncbi:MAG: DNA-directed RNA polymerase subunit beta' [Caldisericia bacterium]|nr:DNA-directed RNA polymerase subunit beta' [Caldisericia bacterium]